jgi:hypothetical protein
MEKIRLNHSLIYNDFTQAAQRIYSASLPLQTGNSNASILLPVKRGVLICFLSLHHPHNHLKNISIIYLPLFN